MRIVRLGLLAVIAVGVLMLAACDRVTPAPADAPLPAPVPEGVTMVIDDLAASRAQAVTLRVGQTIAVTLRSNFDWQITQMPEELELVGTETAPTDTAQRDAGATGGANWFVFHLKAVAIGEGDLVLTEAPGWEPESVMQTRQVTVQVEP